MRIIGNIEHPNLKITVFKMDNKLSVKFESGLYEQTFKYRVQEGLENFEDVKKMVSEEMINEVNSNIQSMHQLKMKTLKEYLKSTVEEEFDKII
jgi:predicted DNA-binding protein with PD1-like motif